MLANFPGRRRGLTVLAVLWLAAGAGSASVEVSLPPGGARRVVLFEGYELAASLGAWDRVVGISRYAYDNDLLKRLVPELRRIPAPGTGFEINVEALLALRPDLVVTWSRRPETLEFLKRQGFPILSIYPENLADLRQDLLRLGAALGKEDRAQEVVALMDRHLEQVRLRVAPLAKQSAPRVLWTWGKPTIISGRLGVVPEIITVAGGRNLGEDRDCFNQEVSMETLIALNPEVVLIWGSASYSPESLLMDPKWQTVQAVRNRRVYKTSRASIWSPRVVALTWWMAHRFYPDAISEPEARSHMDKFYRECFGISYEEEP
jgi:iron complex transport system substrate-binding protein